MISVRYIYARGVCYSKKAMQYLPFELPGGVSKGCISALKIVFGRKKIEIGTKVKGQRLRKLAS